MLPTSLEECRHKLPFIEIFKLKPSPDTWKRSCQIRKKCNWRKKTKLNLGAIKQKNRRATDKGDKTTTDKEKEGITDRLQ